MIRAKALLLSASAALLLAGAGVASAEPMVGGAPMYPNRTIVENAVTAPNLTTLVTAVKAAGLAETLSGKGPFTVFAPTNEAFDKLPPGTVTGLLNEADHSSLKKILTYHVVPGVWDSQNLQKAIKSGGGRATLTTVEGEPLLVGISDGKVIITDAHNRNAYVTTADVYQSNGVVHVIDTVLQP